MEDICYEQMVADKRRLRRIMLRSLMITGCAALTLASLIFRIPLGEESSFSLWIVAAVIDFVVFRLFWKKTAVEYEYIFTDGQLDLDVIYNKNSRKRLISFECRDIFLMAPLDEPRNQRLYEEKYTQSFVVTDGLEEEEEAYVVILKKNGKSTKIVFQPDERLCRLMKKYAGRMVELKKSEE